MLIAQLSDPHVCRPGRLLGGRVDTRRLLAASIARLASVQPQPDLVLLTGDLVESGHPQEYALLRELLAAIPQRVLLLPGNHDERSALRAAFPGQPWQADDAFLHYSVDLDGLRLIALDTVLPGQGGGALCAARLAWLEATLASSQQPTLLAMHHPPFETGIREMDEIGLADRAAFAAVVTRHPQLRLIVSGHLHRAIFSRVAACPALCCPSTAHQISLDLRPDAALAYCLEPAGFMLHRWDGQHFVTHQVLAGDFPGPYPY